MLIINKQGKKEELKHIWNFIGQWTLTRERRGKRILFGRGRGSEIMREKRRNTRVPMREETIYGKEEDKERKSERGGNKRAGEKGTLSGREQQREREVEDEK